MKHYHEGLNMPNTQDVQSAKTIKIIKCSNSLLWYSKCIGAEFKVVRFEQSKQRKLTAWVVEPDPVHRFINWVAEGDYEVVEKEEVGGTYGKQD